jgi:pyruvate,water dikinase
LDEDSSDSSFAGQHTTLLNVVGAEAIATAVLQCWQSAFSARARAYRAHHGLANNDVRMSVLVQQFVNADCSAVLFSADPVTGRRDELVINAAWGLGESIVGGTVTPDTYRLRAADLKVVAQQIAVKQRMATAIPGGTREVSVPRFLQHQPALNAEQAVALGQLAHDLEAIAGQPVDIECAYQDGHLYLLQCRPITALPSLSDEV